MLQTMATCQNRVRAECCFIQLATARMIGVVNVIQVIVLAVGFECDAKVTTIRSQSAIYWKFVFCPPRSPLSATDVVNNQAGETGKS